MSSTHIMLIRYIFQRTLIWLRERQERQHQTGKRDDCRKCHSALQVVGRQQVGEDEGTNEGTHLTKSSRNTMCRGTHHHREDLCRIDERSHVWPKLCKEVAHTI